MNIDELIEQIQQKQYKVVHQEILAMNVVDIASLIEELNPTELLVIFRMLHKGTAAEVFAYINSDLQQRIVEAMTDREIASIMNELFIDDAVDFIEEMPASVVKRALHNASQETRNTINQFLQYPEYSAGSIMTNEFVDVRQDWTVERAFKRIREVGLDKETIYTLFVINESRVFEGAVSTRKILLADPTVKMNEILKPGVVTCSTLDDQEVVAQLFRKYDLLTLPVVDKENRLVGVITVDDVIDVIQQENTEDFEKTAAIIPTDDTYLRTSVWEHAKKRILWLTILMLSATLSSIILESYQTTIQLLPVLVTFIPMLMGTSGNSGSQAATLVIRGMALDEIHWDDWFKVVLKEAGIATLVGLGLSLLNIIRIVLFGGDPLIAIVVGITLIIAIFLAKLIGASLPILAKRIGLDPAIMAAPMITTLVDATSIIAYFSIAQAILPGL